MNDAMLQTILLVANGDLRQSANEKTWPGQEAMEKQLTAAVARLGYKLVRAHPYKPELKHGFIASQKEGMAVFAKIDPRTPIIVAEAVQFAQESPEPDPSELYTDVYVEASA